MVLFNSFFNYFDLFGAQYQFNIMERTKFRSFFGFLMSSTCLTIVIIIIILFGIDFFYKLSPKIISENLKTDKYREINLKPENLTIAFRIDDEASNPALEAYEWIHIRVKQYAYIYNSLTLENDDFSRYLKAVPCNNTLSPDLLFSKDKNLTEYFCIDFPSEGYGFGGSFTGDFIKFFYITVGNCDENDNCRNMKDVSEYFSGKMYYFNFYFPSFYFLPNEEKPQTIKYESYYTQISPILFKEDSIYFKEYILIDDIGWIFKNEVTSSLLALTRLKRLLISMSLREKKMKRLFLMLCFYFLTVTMIKYIEVI